jgi:hypothetical protein
MSTISEETNSLFVEYLICSLIHLQSIFFIIALIARIEVLFFTCRFKTTSEPLGTGTLIALELSF